MKKITKLAAIVLALALVLALSACGGGSAKAAKISGVYLTPANLTYHNMRPQYNYYTTTFTQQELTLMDDNSYCLIVSSSTYSALELAESTQDAKGNERDNAITKFYGTYTSKVNDLDEDLLDVTLSKPAWSRALIRTTGSTPTTGPTTPLRRSFPQPASIPRPVLPSSTRTPSPGLLPSIWRALPLPRPASRSTRRAQALTSPTPSSAE